jgi:hypothetical protein
VKDVADDDEQDEEDEEEDEDAEDDEEAVVCTPSEALTRGNALLT